jgi:glycerol-3-phosphate dehydrogenase
MAEVRAEADMRRIETEVLVIGGGATGVGVLRDAAMRGFKAALVERGDLGEGTTGRFHGLLHSGGRYVVKDPRSAKECMDENRVLRRIAADCIEDTGGYFVTTPWDDPEYSDRFVDGCVRAGIPVDDVLVAEALRREPRLNPKILRVLSVPDAAIDAWKTLWGCVRSAAEYGGEHFIYHRVTGINKEDGRVVGADAVDRRTGEEVRFEAGFVINAAGAWGAEVAAMAGCEGITILPGKGIMIAMNHRMVQTVVNRCEMPADGDIIVPIRTVCVIGTTDEKVTHPDDLPVTQSEVDQMLDDGEKLVPGFRDARALRVWAGARPLFKDTMQRVASTRDVSRSHAVLDHKNRDSIEGFITITGGKFTTFRLMAEETVDAMCVQLGVQRACRTHEEPFPDSEHKTYYRVDARLRASEMDMHREQLICECELITKRTLQEAIKRRETTNLDDIRRTVRLAMGPCQGGFCIYRATGILHSVKNLDGPGANDSLVNFLQERWKGMYPILHGDQWRQARLDEWIFFGLLDVTHLPVLDKVAAS